MTLFITLVAPPGWASPDPQGAGAYYVLAPSGLNLRQSADIGSGKQALIPYGASVVMIAPAARKDVTIDQITGGMARVKYEGKEGYLFDGFLSRFPAPVSGMEPGGYVEKIRSAGLDVYMETVNRDWGGYVQAEEAVVLKTENWAEAFLVAKQLFAIPSKLCFPGPSTERETVLINPEKATRVWSDELNAIRKEDGSLSEIRYYYRTEGGGKTVIISYDDKERGLRLARVFIGD